MSASEVTALQEQIADVVHRYAALIDSGQRFPPVSGPDVLSATEIATICSHLLKVANIAVFELAMWDSWNA
ncbi:MAG: hypothetical protein V7607_5914 [Solirubrobacteraceae bacterium]